MTAAERKRALMIEKTSRMYGTMGSVNSMLAILTIGILICEVCMFFIAAPGQKFLAVFLWHSLFLPILSGLVVIINTHPIGTTGYVIEENVYVSTPPNHTERFLCILPFEAKDYLNLYFTSFEKQLAVITGSVIFLQIAAELFRPEDYTIKGEYIGICCLTSILYEVLLMIILLTGIRVIFAILIIHAPAIPLVHFCTYVDGLPEKSQADIMEIFRPLDIFSGASGIIIMIIIAAAMAFIGELCLRRKTDVSWNIKNTT
ncbi:MAG: hypothetical protein J1E40_12080 [Oscillospiraceae bacterium]|nr:hypothetical protein [Oscillospiraceae bacterium]